MEPINTYGSISLNYVLYNDFFQLNRYQNMPNILSKHTHGGYEVKGIPIQYEKVGTLNKPVLFAISSCTRISYLPRKFLSAQKWSYKT